MGRGRKLQTSKSMVQRKWAAQKPGRKRLVWRGRAAHVWRMNFPQFWAKGVSGGVVCWRWSSRSVAEAQALATQAAGQLAERIRALDFSSSSASGGGYYPNRAMREPILQEFRDGAGEIAAVVTRNVYGCRVLNTARVMFVDIDLRELEHHRGLISRLLGIPPMIMPLPVREFEVTLTRIEAWTQEHPEWGWRIYRTRAGLRLLATQGFGGGGISGGGPGVCRAGGGSPVPQAVPDAEMFSGAAHAQAVALRLGPPAGALALADAKDCAAIQPMGGALSGGVGQVVHV